MSDSGKFKVPSKEKFYSSLTDRKINDKEYEHVLNVWKKLKWKRCKVITTCTYVLLLAHEFEKFRNNSLKN